MATCNGERFLEEQLASIEQQTEAPRELVVVDDVSSDSTLEVLQRFAARARFPVEILRNDRRLGHGRTFFRALEHCHAELVAFCDQDDVWLPGKIAACADQFHRDRGLALVVHAGRVADEQLRPTRVRIPRIRRSEVLSGEHLSPWFVHRGFAMVIPRWLAQLAGATPRPRAFRRVEDRPMDHDEWACFVAAAAGPVALVAEELVIHRRHGENFSILEAPGPPVPGMLRRTRRSEASLTVLRPSLGGDRGVAGLFDVATKVQAYRNVAGQFREAAAYLRRLGAVREDLFAERGGDLLVARAGLYERAAMILEGRADAVGMPAPLLTRLSRIAGLAARGGYGRTTRGGLGPASAAVDLAVALAGRTRRAGGE